MNTHVGMPPDGWEGWESHLVHFNGFESLPTEKGASYVLSPRFTLFNHEWSLRLYPGGDNSSRDGMMSLYLLNFSDTEVTASFGFKIKEASGKVIHTKEVLNRSFAIGPSRGWKSLGWKDYIERSKITNPSNNVLNHGTLTVEVGIKLDGDHYNANFIPRNAFAQNMLRSFIDEDTSDVIFNVKGQDEPSTTVQFHAHKLVLQFCAEGSTLASLCEEYDKSTPVPITDVDPEVFKQMLYYVYGGKIGAAEWKEKSKDFIDAGDKYGLKDFKIEAEAWHVKHLEITVANVVEELIYADKMNCFLLKEAAMNFVLKNSEEVLASDSFENMPKSDSVMREIVSLAAINNRADDKENSYGVTKLSINELRAKLHENGKDIDGPRNALIAQLVALMNDTNWLG